MELTPPPGHLSGSQSSLASETGPGSADPQRGTPPRPDPKGPSEYPATSPTPHCLSLLGPPSPRALLLSYSVPQNWKGGDEVFNSVRLLSSGQALREPRCQAPPCLQGTERNPKLIMVTIPLSIIRDAHHGCYILSFTKRVTFHFPISVAVAVAPISGAPTMLQAPQSSPSPMVCPVWTGGGAGQPLASAS